MPRLSLAALAQNAVLWPADALASPIGAVLATGHAALDAQLPDGGWPVGAMVKILQAQSGQNEWRLLLSALAHAGPGPVVLIGAPHVPFGPGLAAQGLALERLSWVVTAEPASRMWACEQALRCTEVVAVLAWLPQAGSEQLRRLNVAAAEHAKLLFIVRPAQVQTESSPAPLRLLVSLQPGNDAVQLEILKRRGPPLTQPVRLAARNGRLAALLSRNQGRAASRPTLGVPVALPDTRAVESANALDRIANTS